jgi:hypothetical protein
VTLATSPASLSSADEAVRHAARPSPAAPEASSVPGSLWIFSRRVDLLVFALPALASLALCAALRPGADAGESPEWVWIAGVLLVDVAHVWSTAFVTYLEPSELRRHPQRYWLVPGAGWALGVVLYGLGGAGLFWRCLAYLAVFHFVRQQYGWLMLYRARARERGRLGAAIDSAAIYAATLYPLVWWHAHLPRRFAWFVHGDFAAGLPLSVADAAGAVYVACLGAYALRALARAWRREPMPWGKHLLLIGTSLTWYVGIVLFDDDVTFTLTNVFVHGIPYAALIFSYARHTRANEPGPGARLLGGSPGAALVRFVACLWVLAYLEELLWDRSLWHEREYLFGTGFDLLSLEAWLVPLLAVPQLTHYVVDGLFWRRGANPELARWVSDPRK